MRRSCSDDKSSLTSNLKTVSSSHQMRKKWKLRKGGGKRIEISYEEIWIFLFPKHTIHALIQITLADTHSYSHTCMHALTHTYIYTNISHNINTYMIHHIYIHVKLNQSIFELVIQEYFFSAQSNIITYEKKIIEWCIDYW